MTVHAIWQHRLYGYCRTVVEPHLHDRIGKWFNQPCTDAHDAVIGNLFSYHNFPEWSIGAIKLLPLTSLADSIRAIFNEGAGWLEIVVPTTSLSLFGIVCFVVGMKLFKWQ